MCVLPALLRALRLPLALTALALAAPLALPTHASPPPQDAQPLRYGDTVSGTLTETTPCVLYRFAGNAGDPVTIDMRRTSGDLDGVLALYQGAAPIAERAPLAENDDRPAGGLDPLLSLTLPATESYLIAACRIQAPQMRITTGNFSLTLSGPSAPGGPTPTPVAPLSGALFGPTDTAAPPPSPTPEGQASPTPVSPLLQMLTDESAPSVLVPGELISGALGAQSAAVRYSLTLPAGGLWALEWQRAGETGFAPLLRLSDEAGAVLAEAAVPVPVPALRLIVAAPAATTWIVTVTRFEEPASGPPGAFTLRAQLIAAPAASGPTLAPDAAPAPDYLAAPCQSAALAVPALAQSALLIDVYAAAGDSYYASELTRTDVFRRDDDLNVVFRLQNTSGPVSIAGVFCAPDGSFYDAGESSFEVGGPYLIGLDWEYLGARWPAGAWYAELYVQDVLALSLAFRVE